MRDFIPSIHCPGLISLKFGMMALFVMFSLHTVCSELLSSDLLTGVTESGDLLQNTDLVVVAPYQAFLPGRTATYADGEGLNTFAKADSIEVIEGGYRVHYKTFVAVTGEYCWLPDGLAMPGNTMLLMDDGHTNHINRDNDTIALHSNARLNDQWTAYCDSSVIVTAMIKAIDEMLVFDLPDSVKIIKFKVFDQEMKSIPHLMNDKEIVLSKTFGLVKTLNFNLFPHSIDYYTLEGLSDPDIGIQHLTRMRVYDFYPGDELHVVSVDFDGFFSDYRDSETKTAMRYLARQEYADSLVLEVERKNLNRFRSHYDSAYEYTLMHDTVMEVIVPDRWFDLMSGEPEYIDDFFYVVGYQWGKLTDRDIYKTIEWAGFTRGFSEDCAEPAIYDGCYYQYVYKVGLGGPYYSCDWIFSLNERQLVYYKKGENTWGTPLDFSVSSIHKPDPEILVYPNPASDYFRITLPDQYLPAQIEIYNITGKLVLNEILSEYNSGINTVWLPSGVYLYRIVNTGSVIKSGKLLLK